MDREKEFRFLFIRDFGPTLQRHFDVPFARERHGIFSQFQLALHFEGETEGEVFFSGAAGDGAEIRASVPGIEDDLKIFRNIEGIGGCAEKCGRQDNGNREDRVCVPAQWSRR